MIENQIQKLAGDDLLEFHQAVVSTLRDADDVTMPLDPAPMAPILPQLQPNNPLLTHTSEDMARLSETHNELGTDQLEEEADTGKRRRNTQTLSSMSNVCWTFCRVLNKKHTILNTYMIVVQCCARLHAHTANRCVRDPTIQPFDDRELKQI